MVLGVVMVLGVSVALLGSRAFASGTHVFLLGRRLAVDALDCIAAATIFRQDSISQTWKETETREW